MAKESDNSESDDNADLVKRAKPATEVFKPFDLSSGTLNFGFKNRLLHTLYCINYFKTL